MFWGVNGCRLWGRDGCTRYLSTLDQLEESAGTKQNPSSVGNDENSIISWQGRRTFRFLLVAIRYLYIMIL